MPATSTIKPEEREFVVDSGASRHMVSKSDLDAAELETMKISKYPNDRDDGQRRGANKRRSHGICQRIGLVRDSNVSRKYTAVLSLGKLCEDHGYTCHWTSGQKPHLTKDDKRISCNISNYVPFVAPGLSTSSSTSSSPVSSTSSSQDTVGSTENPATERSEILSEESR